MLFRSYVRPVPLLRVYARFDTKWWKDTRVAVDSPVRYFIPIGNSHIVMASYTDGDLAREWYTLHKRDPECAESRLVRLLRDVFGAHVPEPTGVRFYFWDTGVHLTPPLTARQMSPSEWSVRVSHPNATLPLFLANEAYSGRYQQWVEGALQSAEQAVKGIRSMHRLRQV